MAFRDLVNNMKWAFQVNKPELFTGFGSGLVFWSGVWACKNTFKEVEILEDHNAVREQIQQIPDEQQRQIETTKLYGTTTRRSIMNYTGPVLTAITGFGFIVAGDVTLRSWNTSLSTALALKNEAFDTYRQNTRERFGDEVDQQLLRGEKPVEVTHIPAENEKDENGKKKKPYTETVLDTNPDALANEHARYFTPKNVNWRENEDFMFNFFKGILSVWKERLSREGHVVLNDVYRDFGFDDAKNGLIAGWVKGDDLDIIVTKKKIPDEFGQPMEAYLIEFNCRDNIYADWA